MGSIFNVTICAAVFLILLSTGVSASEPFDFVDFRKQADADFQQKLDELATICEQEGLPQQAELTRDWSIRRDPGRQHIFLPADVDPVQPSADAEKRVIQWYQAFSKLRAEQADWLFAQAREHHLMYPALSYQLLHETLHENPEHADARAMLGFKREHRITTRKVKLRLPVVPDQLLWQAQSENFKVITTGDEETAVAVAEKFERWYDVWQQLFYSFWAHPRHLGQTFDGQPPSERSRQHLVIVYRDKQEYDARLAPLIPGVEVSSGYYDHKLRQSFFFAEGATDESTWRHELTHQLFQELVRDKRRDRKGPVDEHGVWALEGIAMYMESLRDFDQFVTVGGFESPRLQYARLDRFRMLKRFDPEQLMMTGLRDFQAHADVVKLYPLCAAWCHFLMDADRGRFRPALLEYMHELYSGKSTASGLLEKVDLDSQGFDDLFAKFLFVSEEELVNYLRRPEDLTVLSLVPGNIGDDGAAVLSRAVNLELLDLTASGITDAGVAKLTGLEKLSQLFLEKTEVGDQAMRSIASLKNIQELDLTQTLITNEGLDHLASLPELKVLWLSGTRIDDGAVPVLQKLAQRVRLEVSGTHISEPQRKKLTPPND